MILLYRLQDSPPGSVVAGDPRGRAGGGQQRHQHRHHQAPGLRARCVVAGFAGVFCASKFINVTPEPVRVQRVVHGAGDGGPRRHRQHVGRRDRRLHHLHDPERPAETAQPCSSTRFHVPIPERDRLRPVPVPAVRHLLLVGMMLLRPEGLFPNRRRAAELQPPRSRAGPTSRAGIRRPAGPRRHVTEPRRCPGGRRLGVADPPGPAARSVDHQAVRWAGRGPRQSTWSSRRLDHQPHRAQRRRQDDVLQRGRGHHRPDRGVGRRSGPEDGRADRERGWLEPFFWVGAGVLVGLVAGRGSWAAVRSANDGAGFCIAAAVTLVVLIVTVVDRRSSGRPGTTGLLERVWAFSAAPGPTTWCRPVSAGPSRTSACSRT